MDQYKLDLKDRKILYELDLNARQPCSAIAKKVGLSTEVVNYRIKRLEEEKIITQYQIVLDLAKLGIIQFKIVLSFQHMDSEKLSNIIKRLESNKEVKWIASCKGNWDIIISAEAKSLQEINVLKDKIISAFSGYIREKAVSICYKSEVYNRDFLTNNKSLINRERILFEDNRKVEIDELDLKIIKELSENGRKPIVDIAYKLRESERVINYRIKQLIKNKIISGFRIAINYSKIGINFYKTFFYLENPKKERVEQLLNYFKSNKNIIHNVQVLGNWELEPEFEVNSEAEFDNILKDIRDKFSDTIKSIDILTISKEHKFVYF
ncbi:HTH-type transcriptional regulator Ptr1 [uncultured archaeon]|nr:HTH-type transcriptional regulator Ptr1 [uncultured archaeon]